MTTPTEEWRTEEWREVARNPRYQVSSLGRVLGPRGFIMKATPAPYPAVKLTFPGPRQVSVRVHVLVAEAFLPPRPTPAHEVRHWDGDRMNNAATNLRWGTRSDNVQDALRHGTHQGGLAHVRAWLTDDQVKEARAAYEAGATVRELADKYDAGWTTMWRIVTRRSRI